MHCRGKCSLNYSVSYLFNLEEMFDWKKLTHNEVLYGGTRFGHDLGWGMIKLGCYPYDVTWGWPFQLSEEATLRSYHLSIYNMSRYPFGLRESPFEHGQDVEMSTPLSPR